MGRQTAFCMTEKDVLFFLNQIPDMFKILKEEYDEQGRVLREISGDEKGKMNGTYYLWNISFPIENIRENPNKLPVIEFYCCTHNSPPYGRIYWNTYYQDQYDSKGFEKWYSKCIRILRKNAVLTYGKGVKEFVYADALEKYNDEIQSKILNSDPHFRGNIDDYFVRPAGYKNILLLNKQAKCSNNCPDCLRTKSNATDNANVYIEAFNSMDIRDIEYLFIGIGFDPLLSQNIKLTEHIKKNSDIRIILITNGLMTGIRSSDGSILTAFSISDIYGADEIYVFIPADTPEGYLAKTNSSYGEKAYDRVMDFLRILKKYTKNLEKHGIKKFIMTGCTRNDVYEYLCKKYGKAAGTNR